MSASITFDDSLCPLIIVRFSGGFSDKQFEEYLARAEAIVRRQEKVVCILDMTRSGMPSSEQRRLQVAWIKKHEAELREVLLGKASIITSAPMRLVVSLILHLSPLPAPYLVTTDMDSAVRFVTAILEERGLCSEAERIRRHFEQGHHPVDTRR